MSLLRTCLILDGELLRNLPLGVRCWSWHLCEIHLNFWVRRIAVEVTGQETDFGVPGTETSLVEYHRKSNWRDCFHQFIQLKSLLTAQGISTSTTLQQQYVTMDMFYGSTVGFLQDSRWNKKQWRDCSATLKTLRRVVANIPVGEKIPFNLPHIFRWDQQTTILQYLTDDLCCPHFQPLPTQSLSFLARSSAAVRPHREEIPFDELE